MTEKVAVITGSNKGLGFAVVKGLCQKLEGTVYLTARDEMRGLEAVKKLNEIGLKPAFHVLDVSDKESVKKFADYLKNKHGGFDVLVNNAAILEWDEVYPSYEAAKRNIDVNYKSLLTIETYLYPLLRYGARVVNLSSRCAHLSNLKNKKWIETLQNPDLTVEQINNFVDDYLDSVKNGTFDRNDFADEGKHAEYRVSKIAFTALTIVQQKKYEKRNISINAVHPGHVKTDFSRGGGNLHPDEGAQTILYLIFEASPSIRGTFLWYTREPMDWRDADTDFAIKNIW